MDGDAGAAWLPGVDLPRVFTIRESSHRVHNPFTEADLATLGRALRLAPGTRIPDLACGTGELLCTWARDHGTTGTGVDISTVFLGTARERAAELGVADRVGFVHGDASGHVADAPVDLAACIGATWIGGGVTGTVGLLDRSVRPGAMLLIGEPYWRREPPDLTAVEACHTSERDQYFALPELLEHFGELGLGRGGDGARRPAGLGPVRRGAVVQHPPVAGREPRRRAGR